MHRMPAMFHTTACMLPALAHSPQSDREEGGMLPVLSCRQTARQGVSHSTNAAPVAVVVLSVLQPQTDGKRREESEGLEWENSTGRKCEGAGKPCNQGPTSFSSLSDEPALPRGRGRKALEERLNPRRATQRDEKTDTA